MTRFVVRLLVWTLVTGPIPLTVPAAVAIADKPIDAVMFDGARYRLDRERAGVAQTLRARAFVPVRHRPSELAAADRQLTIDVQEAIADAARTAEIRQANEATWRARRFWRVAFGGQFIVPRATSAPAAPPASVCTGTTDGTTIIWIAQTSAGTGLGTSAANARALSFVESGGNWGGGTTDIDPGDTVCGTGSITEVEIDPAGDGSAGNPVIFDMSNATLSTSTNWHISENNYLTIRYATWVSGASPSIGALFSICGADHIVMEYATGLDLNTSAVGIYVSSDCAGGTTVPTDITVRGSHFQSFTGTPGELDLIRTESSNGVLIEGNLLEMRATGAGHDDVIQMYHGGCTPCMGNPPQNWTLRYNFIILNTTTDNDKSWFMNEATTGTNYVYGNVLLGIDGADSANGFHTETGTSITWRFYNNTVLAKAGTVENTITFTGTGTLAVRNNIVRSGASTRFNETMTQTCSNNSWSGGGGGSCSGTGDSTADPLFTSEATNDLTLQAGSPAKGAGTTIANVGSETFDYGPCPTATWPNPDLCQRSATWDMGAFVMTP